MTSLDAMMAKDHPVNTSKTSSTSSDVSSSSFYSAYVNKKARSNRESVRLGGRTSGGLDANHLGTDLGSCE